MSRRYYEYDESTGAMTTRVIMADATMTDDQAAAFAQLNVRAGFAFVEGMFDPRTQMVDLATKTVVAKP
jgi:hypothetical protein